MTRNSLDDLLIANYLLICYIDFLQNRVEQQNKIIESEFSTLQTLLLPKECKAYISMHKKEHLESTNKYLEFLLEIENKISDFFEINQRPIPLYSKEVYRQNLQMHKNELEKIFNNLFKNQ